MFYGSDNFSVGVGLSIASPTHHTSRYMADQTFHTPNFGDEEFDIPPIALPQSGDGSHGQGNMSYSMGMGHGGPDQQGHHYASMYLPDHMTTPMTMHSPVSYGGSPPTYTTLSSPHSASQSPMGNSHMMHHPQNTRPQQAMMGPNAPPGRSPTNSNSSPANPETTTSDDSDDSVPVSQMTPALKRPSPEPVDSRSMSAAAAAVKKPKAQKKKKKRDPNEPQKPVSAYALFFRDTQAAIKGQNPNASFGEVSKIVASMWDALDADHKNVYKKKTEAAKKEYLKALAAYRASLVSKGASTDSADGSGMYPPSFNTSIPAQQHYTPHTPSQTYYSNQGGQGSHAPATTAQQKKTQQQQQQSPAQQNPSVGVQQGMQSQQQQQNQTGQAQSQQQQQHQQQQQQQQQHQQQSHQGHAMMSHMTNSHLVDTNQYGQMRHTAGYMNPMGDAVHGMISSGMHMQNPGGHGQMPGPGPAMSHLTPDSHNHNRQQMCIRNGCNNAAMTSPEWDDEYCSSECVVTHCRNVFTNWVSSNQGGNTSYGNSVKFNGPGNSGVVGADGLSYVT